MPNRSAIIQSIVELANDNKTTSVETVIAFLESNNKWFSCFVNGNQFFIFLWRGKIRILPERTIFLILAFTLPIGIFGVRKLISRFKSRAKLRSQIRRSRFRSRLNALTKRIRAGADEVPKDLEVLKDNIVHYEQDLVNIIQNNQNVGQLFPQFPPIVLPPAHAYLRDIINKCLLPNKIYRITNGPLANLIKVMIKFRKRRRSLALVSYDVFVLALVNSIKPGNEIIFVGLSEFIPNTITKNIISFGPAGASLFSLILFWARVKLNMNPLMLVTQYGLSVFGSYKVWDIANFMRATFIIDCLDYVQELSTIKREALLGTSNSTGIVSSDKCQMGSDVSYTRTEPTQNDAFVSTYPNSDCDIYYQQDVNPKTSVDMKTLKPNTTCQSIDQKTSVWADNAPDTCLETYVEQKYTPLKTEVKRLSDVRTKNQRDDLEATQKIIEAVQEKQVRSIKNRVRIEEIDKYYDEL